MVTMVDRKRADQTICNPCVLGTTPRRPRMDVRTIARPISSPGSVLLSPRSLSERNVTDGPLDVRGRPPDYGTPNNNPPAGAHCCYGLALGWAFLEIDASYKSAKSGGTHFTRLDGTVAENIPDVLTLGPMLRLVGVFASNPFGGGNFPEPRKIWRCAHAGPAPDYRCAIYDRRPALCREYPTNLRSGRCEYLNCQSPVCKFRPQVAAARTQETP